MWCVIPAAGIGSRFQSDDPKQYLQLNSGQTVLEKTIESVLKANSIEGIVVALNQNDHYFDRLVKQKFTKPVLTCIGGETRQASVYQGLIFLKKQNKVHQFVCVHDAARPLVLPKEIDQLNAYALTLTDASGVILAAEVSDTLKQVNQNKIIKTLERANIYRALTPQTIDFEILLKTLDKCLKEKIDITDEASALEAFGYSVEVMVGTSSNIKLTYPSDLLLINAILASISD